MTDRRDIDILIAGHACLDIIPSFPGKEKLRPEKVFRPGGLVVVGGASICLGGPVSNTGIGMTKLGASVHFVTRLGDDMFGEETLKLMDSIASVDGVHVVAEEESSYTVAIAPPGIDRIFFHNPGTNNTFCSTDIKLDLCRRAKIFHLGYPPLMRKLYENDGKELIEIFKQVKQEGAITSLDMALPDANSPVGKINWRGILENLLPFVDFFLPSIEESLFMADREKYDSIAETEGDVIDKLDGDDYTALSDMFIEWGAKVITLKSGHRGIYCRTASKENLQQLSTLTVDTDSWADRECWTPAFEIQEIASATGSGDSAIAGLVIALLKGESYERALRYAVALGYQNLHGLDGTSGIKNWDYSTKLVNDMDKPLIPFELHSSGWKFSEENKLWYGPRDKK